MLIFLTYGQRNNVFKKSKEKYIFLGYFGDLDKKRLFQSDLKQTSFSRYVDIFADLFIYLFRYISLKIWAENDF